jgi:DNA-directed RNA polymerase subunit RPC12/RpoP
MQARQEKKHYLVLTCSACNRYLLAISRNRTRSCPYCGKRIHLGKAKIYSRSESAEEARLVLQKLKLHEQGGSPQNNVLR